MVCTSIGAIATKITHTLIIHRLTAYLLRNEKSNAQCIVTQFVTQTKSITDRTHASNQTSNDEDYDDCDKEYDDITEDNENSDMDINTAMGVIG